MPTDNLYALFPEYQREMRALIAQLTNQHRYDGQTKAIVDLLKAGRTDDALFAVLQLRSELKTFLGETLVIFNEVIASESQIFLKYVELRRKVFEAIQEAAAESGEQETDIAVTRELDKMTEYFGTSIAYLDFEPEKEIR